MRSRVFDPSVVNCFTEGSGEYGEYGEEAGSGRHKGRVAVRRFSVALARGRAVDETPF